MKRAVAATYEQHYNVLTNTKLVTQKNKLLSWILYRLTYWSTNHHFSKHVMDTILNWISFDQEATCDCLQAEGFEFFADTITMKEKEVRNLAES